MCRIINNTVLGIGWVTVFYLAITASFHIPEVGFTFIGIFLLYLCYSLGTIVLQEEQIRKEKLKKLQEEKE